MQHADETLLSVVVLERGSSWPPWLAEYQKHAPDSLVVAQSADETSPDFAQRINRKVDEVGSRGAAIHAGLLVCNGSLDAASVIARRVICASLLGLMLDRQRGELVLVADVTAGDDVRQELFALAGILCDELHGGEVSVRVRFDSVRPSKGVSGVMKSAAPPASGEPAAKVGSERVLNGLR